MHDPKGKRRDLRKAFLGGDRPKLYSMFDQIHPEFNWENQDGQKNYGHLWYHICHKAQDEWISETTGAPRSFWGWGSPPAHFRRDLNRKQRTMEKRVLRIAVLDDDWDDFALPSPRKNAGWLYW